MSSEISGRDAKTNGSTNDDDATKSRTRVSRACTRCRTRKDRCDGLRPSCTACINAQQICCYEPSTKKRGLPEGYVRGLEKLFALLMGKLDGFEEITSSILKDNRLQLSRIWNHAVVGEELHTTWKDSRIVAELEGLLSSLDQTSHNTGQKRKRDRDDDGGADDPDSDTTFHITSEHQIINPELVVATSNTATPALAKSPPLPRQALQLLDQYFAHTNCWFPILRRPDLTRACYEMARGHATSTNQSMAPLLWAVFSYASRQSKVPETFQTADPSPDTMREIALGLLPSDMDEYLLVHAQALLILSLIEIGDSHWKSAWVLIGKATRVVLFSSLLDKGLDKVNTATLQGCAVLDIAIAAHMNRIPHLREQDFAGIPRLPEDGHEEWEPWNGPDGFRGQREPSFGISTFNRLTEVYFIISEALSLQPQLRKPDKLRIQTLLAKLHELQASFPGQMPPSAHSPPHQIYLQLCHVSAQMRLVDLPVEVGARSHERAKLACNLLSLLALCKNAPAVSLAHIPPFCFDGFVTAGRLAQQSKDCFGPITGLPSFQQYQQTFNEYAVEVSTVWPLYKQLSGKTMYSDKLTLHTNQFVTTTDDAMILRDKITTQDYLHESHLKQRDSVLTPGQIDDQVMSLGAIANSWAVSGSGIDVDTTIDHDNMISSTQTPPFGGRKLVSKYAGSGLTPVDIDQNIVDASPSFHGDEIDAIFHEMAHLDTNEWTTDRATGLKDFGFSDDLTFQAFCNDPDRLVGSDVNGGTLSSNLQTWMFTSDAD